MTFFFHDLDHDEQIALCVLILPPTCRRPTKTILISFISPLISGPTSRVVNEIDKFKVAGGDVVGRSLLVTFRIVKQSDGDLL